MNCPKCDGEMEEGHIPEYLDYMFQTDHLWKSGPKQPVLRKVATEEKNIEEVVDREYKIQTFRCRKCGYLESYAK